ncbi:MAG: hypothetical protein NTAFB09_07390 [Nitrosospira sp.]|jgi:hypothetical protein
MKTFPFKRSLIILLVPALFSLTGCNIVRFGYNQADHVTYWWLDRFVDFDETQGSRVRAALARWFSWHRREHLPRYAGLLTHSRTMVLEDTTPERTCGLWTEIRGYMDEAFEHALPIAVDITSTLTPRQIQNIERRYARINEEFDEDHVRGNAEARLKRSINRTVERAEFFYGKLDSQQREFIKQRLAASPYEVTIWNAERHRRQQDLVQLLRQLTSVTPDPDRIQQALRAYMERVYNSPNEAYRKYSDNLWAYNCGFVAGLHNTATPAQRAHAAKKIRGWESDIQLLLMPTETARADSLSSRPGFPALR